MFKLKYIIFCTICICSSVITAAQTGIGTTTPNASAKLDVYSTDKGFLPPRVTLISTTDASTITSPAEGLLVYNLGSVGLQAGYYYWNGASWATIATATSAGNGVTASNLVKLYGEIHSSATGKISNASGFIFTVPVSGRYLFDFTSSGTAINGGTATFYFQVRQGTTVIGSDMQSSYNNNVHVEYNGKVEVNLQAGVSYNVYNYTTSGSFETNDYDRVYYKLVAGNLPVTGQSVDYIQASLSANQTLTAAGNVIFNTSSGAGITLTSGGFELKANKTYKLEAALGGSSSGYAYYAWIDNANNLLTGGSVGVVMKAGTAYTDAAQDKAVVFYTPTTNTTVYLRVLNVSGNIVAYAPPAANNYSSTWATIQQVGSSAFVNPWVLTGNDVFNNTGKVGIGTTTPAATLDVTGNVNVTGKINLSDASGNVATKASGLVGRGTDITLGNLKARFAATGYMSLQVSTVSGTYSVYGSGSHVSSGNGWATIDGASPLSVTTTPAYLKSTLSFGGAGNTDTWIIMDTASGITWRIIGIVGSGYLVNFISIERLL